MNAWDRYSERMALVGTSKRESIKRNTMESIRRRILSSPACKKVLIDGVPQMVGIAHTEDMNVKRICSIPGEHLKHGGLVHFAENHWLITEMDADNEMYDRGKMTQCNYVVKWIGKDGKLKEKWCIVEDGTKYLIGENERQLMTVGDSRLSLTVAKDEDTVELSRGTRFLIDDEDSDDVSAFRITKPNKLYNVYNGQGVFRFILREVLVTPDDNKALRIADYNNWKPEQVTDNDHVDSAQTVAQIVSAAQEESKARPLDDKEVWL